MKSYLDNLLPPFDSIVNSINTFYPVGEDGKRSIHTFIGSDLIVNKFAGTDAHKNWKNFLEELSINFSEKVKSLSTSQEPSYSIEIEIEKHEIGHLENRLVLVCSISLLAQVYLIYGLEEVRLSRKYEGMRKPYSFLTNEVKIVSPEGLVEPYFLAAKNQLVRFFPESKQLPFFALESKVRDFYLDDPTQEGSVFDALFRGLGHSHIHIHGNPYYAQEEWH